MKLTIHLHTVLQRQTPSGRVSQVQIELPDGATVEQAIEELAITMSPRHMMLLVNGRVAKSDTPLSDGDEVNLIPAISGGGPATKVPS